MTIRSAISFALVVSLLASFNSVALAQLPPGKDCYVWPPGAKRGQTVEIRLGGSDWTPDVQFFTYHPTVKFAPLGPPGEVLVPEGPFWFGQKSFLNDPLLPREVVAKLTLPADLPPGPVRWAVANANGAGGGGVFIVGSGDEVTEDETRTKPQELTLPVTVNGRLRRIEEADRYTFTAAASGLVTLDLFVRRLGNEFNGVLEVTADGKRVAEAVDTEGTDPAVTFAVERGKAYTVSVRDVDHRGYRNFTYRLALTTGPRVVAAVPPCGRAGERLAVEFVGYGLATGAAKLERVTEEVEFRRLPVGEMFTHTLHTPFGDARFPLHISDTAERVESTDRTLGVPGAVTGRIEKRGERDAYTSTGRKGEVWELAVQANRLGSPVDARLFVVGPDGKQLGASDDDGTNPDPRLSVTLPADGAYTAIVADVSGKQPGLDAVYRLVVRRPESRFALKVAPLVNVPVGGKATLQVDVVREGAFKEPVTLSLGGLPDGVTVPKELVIPPGTPSLAVPLDCAKTAAAVAGYVRVTGTAKVGDTQVSVVAETKDGGPDVLLATTLKPPFKVKSPEADGTRKVFRGSTHLADLIVERTDGFAGEIVLDMAGAQQRHRQGIRGPAFTVAPTVGKVLYPVTLPEWLETTRTSRIGLVAMAKIPDPKGTPRWVLAPMDGQVTMSVEGALLKLSRAADEVVVKCGEAADVPLKLARSPQLTGAVKLELVIPPELKELVSAAPLEWPADKPSAELKLTTIDDPKLAGVRTLTVRATGTRQGYPVVSETTVEVEFTRPK